VTAAFGLAFLAKERAIDLLYNKCTINAKIKVLMVKKRER
jgi:hypothetical protein